MANMIKIRAIGVNNSLSNAYSITVAVDKENVCTLVNMFSQKLIRSINHDDATDILPECWWTDVPLTSLRNVTIENDFTIVNIEL